MTVPTPCLCVLEETQHSSPSLPPSLPLSLAPAPPNCISGRHSAIRGEATFLSQLRGSHVSLHWKGVVLANCLTRHMHQSTDPAYVLNALATKTCYITTNHFIIQVQNDHFTSNQYMHEMVHDHSLFLVLDIWRGLLHSVLLPHMTLIPCQTVRGQF